MQVQSFPEKKIFRTKWFAQKRNPISTEDLFYKLSRMVVRLYTRVMLEMDVRWQATIPEGPKILAPNHPTTLDPIYLLTLLFEPVSLLVTAAAFNIPGVGGYLRAAGHVPAARDSDGTTVAAIARKIQSGRNVAIFPEGALSPLTGDFHRPHSGIARVALCTGAPVIPIGIGLPRDRISLIRADIEGSEAIGHFYLSGSYAITVGRPLYFAGDVQDHEYVRAVANHIMHHIRNLAHVSERRTQPVQAGEVGTLTAQKYQWASVRNSR